MKLIIDIDEDEYKFLKTNPYPNNIFNVTSAITNGTPIPDNATVCDIEQISSARYNNGFYDGKKAMEEKLEQIRAELHAAAEKHEDGDYYLRDKWVDEIIDKYTEQEPCEDSVSIDVIIEWLKLKDIIKMSNQEKNARKELQALFSVQPKPIECEDAVSREKAVRCGLNLI